MLDAERIYAAVRRELSAITAAPSAQAEPNADLRADFERECADTDKLLTALGLSPENCRTDGGSLKTNMILYALEARDRLIRRTAAAQAGQQVSSVTDEVVNRFLSWELPKDFSPDGGVKFERKVGTADGERDRADMGPGWWPVGTNLLTAEQARAMLVHVLNAAPSAQAEPVAQPVTCCPHGVPHRYACDPCDAPAAQAEPQVPLIERIAALVWEQRGHFVSDQAAKNFADIVRGIGKQEGK